MKHTKFALLIAGAPLALLLASCGSETQGDGNNVAAQGNTNSAQDAGNLFAEAEAKMNEAMMSAVGTDVGDNWALKMIAHHQGAIDMSEIILQQNPPADVAEMARTTIAKQQKDIQDIRKLQKEGTPDPLSAELYRPAMMAMHQKMQAATGANPAEIFMRKMLEHHRGGVTMSDVALQNGVSGALRQQVTKTRDDQQNDAEMVEAMLRGESMAHAMQQSGAKSAEKAKAEPAPADKAKMAPKAATSAKPAAKADAKAVEQPAAEPKATTCSPEHRAAGHC
jgi:uncharacterized protein (DUF305 family)